MNLKNFQIGFKGTIAEALQKIDDNQHGMILVVDDVNKVIGLCTDGDIRRSLLSGNSLDASIEVCMNRDFVWASSITPREKLLKQLDNKIRAIPLLDTDGQLASIISRNSLPGLTEEQVYARARAPVRVSFGGGGSDLTHFFWDSNGAVINATISLYSHAMLKQRNDGRIIIRSLDLNDTLDVPDLEAALAHKGKFGLMQAILTVLKPEFGFELYVNSDYPMGSGLGGSAVVTSAILGCFNEFRHDKWDNHELAELAFQMERFNLGVAGGWQDQYASVFGGFNFIEFRKEENVVHPLRISSGILHELEESLILCDTGTLHDSGNIHDSQRAKMKSSDVQDKVKINVELTYAMRNSLLRGKLTELGTNLNKAWMLKRGFSDKISNGDLDNIYQMALDNGALGGKLLGAGGGGFFLFYVTPLRKFELINALQQRGLKATPFRFDLNGLCSWKVRENQC